jgi:alpha-D-xyloside xylohydrolase
MKFTDGNWLLAPGVEAFHPVEVRDIATTPDSLIIHAAKCKITNRGDTLGGPAITMRFESPMADVIRVTITHFSGARPRGPHFPLLETDKPAVAIDVADDAASFTSGRLTARVHRQGPWSVDFVADGAILTRSPERGTGYIRHNTEGPYIHEQLSLGVGGLVYGLGERFSAFVKNGQEVDIWNKDGGAGSEQTYKNVPFFLTNRGYGAFINHPERVGLEVASEKVSRVQFSVAGESLDYFLIYGPTPKEILDKYTALTGRPVLPPAWSFGLWLTTSFLTSYDEGTTSHFIEEMARRDLPLSVFHFDCFWMKDCHWCNFLWDRTVFPDPAEMLARMKARGLHICVWINPYIAQESYLFEEGQANGYLLKRANGDVWQIDDWQPGMGIVDFTNPDAVRWFSSKLRALVDMGVDSFKTDFGERIPTDVVYHDGSDPVKMHNYYAYLYNKVVFDVLEEARGAGEAVLFARASTSCGQRFPVHWGGDCHSTFEAMAESLRGGLSLCLSGFGFWSHDIGGFEGTPPTDLYKRWIPFGLLSSHSRLHGSGSYRVPWLFDEESVDVLRFFTKLKCRLMPYLYGAAVQSHRTGTPVMRAMMLEFPDDPGCEYLDRQFMLGDSLLVAPVFSGDGAVTYYLPAGRWTHYLTGEVQSGPGWFRANHGFMSLPLFARAGSVIAEGAVDTRPDYDYTEGLTPRIYELSDGATARTSVPHLDGSDALAIRATRSSNRIEIAVEGQAKSWRVLFVGVTAVESIEGGTAQATQDGLLVTANAGVATLVIHLPG